MVREGRHGVSKVLDAAWRNFAERVIPADAPDIQRIECRRCFYAGAQALLTGIMVMLDPGTEPTDADLSRMEGISAELERFGKDVAEGRA